MSEIPKIEIRKTEIEDFSLELDTDGIESVLVDWFRLELHQNSVAGTDDINVRVRWQPGQNPAVHLSARREKTAESKTK